MAAAGAFTPICNLVHVEPTLSLTIVLFLYDTVLTFDREVVYFWTAKRISGAALLFFANKWISMMYYVMLLVGFASFPSDKVGSLSQSHGNSDQNQRFV